MLETELVRAGECWSYCHVGRDDGGVFSILCGTEVCCVFSLESLHRGDSNEYTTKYRFQYLNKSKISRYGIFSGDSGVSSKEP